MRGWIILFIFVAAALLLLAVGARAHETAAAEGIPDYVYLSGCCNKNDCKMIKFEAVEMTAEGYRFEVEQRPGHKFEVKEEEAHDSSDGRYWACFIITSYCAVYGPEKLYHSQYGSSLYRPCLKYIDHPTKPWELRAQGKKKCFWRPVNA